MRLLTLALTIALVGSGCSDDGTVSGAEVQTYLRERLGPQPGVDLDPGTFACPLETTIGPDESMVCLANGREGTTYEFEVKAYSVDGELRVVLDVLS